MQKGLVKISYNDIKKYFKDFPLEDRDIYFINIVTRTCENSDFWLFNHSKYSYIIAKYFEGFGIDGVFISKDYKFMVVQNSFISWGDKSYSILPVLDINKNEGNDSITRYITAKPYSPIENIEDGTVSFFHPRKFCNAEAAMLYLCVNLYLLKDKSPVDAVYLCSDNYKFKEVK